METPTLEALLAIPPRQLDLLHAILEMIGDLSEDNPYESLDAQVLHATPTVCLEQLHATCASLGWDVRLDRPRPNLTSLSLSDGLPQVEASARTIGVRHTPMTAHTALVVHACHDAVRLAVCARRTHTGLPCR